MSYIPTSQAVVDQCRVCDRAFHDHADMTRPGVCAYCDKHPGDVRLWANGWSPIVSGVVPTGTDGVPIAFPTLAEAKEWWADLRRSDAGEPGNITKNFPVVYMSYDELVDLLHAEQKLEWGMERKLIQMTPGTQEGRLLYERLMRQQERVRDVYKMVRNHPRCAAAGINDRPVCYCDECANRGRCNKLLKLWAAGSSDTKALGSGRGFSLLLCVD